MEKKSNNSLKEDYINESLTKQAKENPKYLRYITWLKQNGAIFDHVDFPVAFGRFGYIGITAKCDLPPKKAVMFIPNKLMISTQLVKTSILSRIIKKYPEIFSEDETDDADFNILAIFILWERLKGSASFYFDMFEVSECNHSLVSWSDNELNALEDENIKDQVLEFQKDLEDNWLKVKIILEKNHDLFLSSFDIKKIYFWAYEFVMTRCYGWSLPSTFLIPLADFLNHGKYGVDHYLIHEGFEVKEAKKHPEYNIKKKKLDLTDLKPLNSSLNEEEKNNLTSYIDYKQMYIEDNMKHLDKSDEERFCHEQFNSENLRAFIKKINLNKLLTEKNRQIYHYQFFETSDEEDNDTDEEENEESPTIDLCKLRDLEDGTKDEEEIKGDKKNEENIKTIKAQKFYEGKHGEFDELKEGSELDDETEWSWYDPLDENIYFTVTTASAMKKNEQIFNCYGRRNNRFLLMWYGFALKENAYDSIPIRFHLQQKATEFLKNIEQTVMLKHVTIDEFNAGLFMHNNVLTPLDAISKEIRLKHTKICEDLVIFLRYQVMKISKNLNFPEYDLESGYFLNPSSLAQEELIFEYSIRVLNFLRSKLLKTMEEDLDIIANEKDSVQKYFSAIYRKNNKNILDEQLKLAEIILFILAKIRAGFPFKECYMQRHPKYDQSEVEFIDNRLKISWYLRKLYLGIYLQIGQNEKK